MSVEEAPRGILVHEVAVDADGRVETYSMTIPTMFNTRVIEAALRGVPAEYANAVVRLYDPCVPCAVH